MTEKTNPSSTFESIFFKDQVAIQVSVPDYQRAFSWEEKQIELFIADLRKYQSSGTNYYFGHFILEANQEPWEVVDGQQRLTIFVLFLMICRVLSANKKSSNAHSFIESFSTVSYDAKALKTISNNLNDYLKDQNTFNSKHPPTDDQITTGLSLTANFTRSQRRMVLALLRFHQAFQKKELEQDKIQDYIEVIMKASCSHHPTMNKSVAVNIFEMHNTRGIPLSTLEVIKAKLMQFVYEHGGEGREEKVKNIQTEFGEIYAMEERLTTQSFHAEITMDNLLRRHLRAVDDGTKKEATEFQKPAPNSNSEALIEYIDGKLRNGDAQYALNLAQEFKKSVRIMTETVPNWDKDVSLVGDVLILERELSCEFFLLTCRRVGSNKDKAAGRISKETLQLWEKLLFTRNFHDEYYNLKGSRDDFPSLFAACHTNEGHISNALKGYLKDGFRPGKTTGLQSIVHAHLNHYKDDILKNAFFWWKNKMIYAIYKYEKNEGANIREVMKGTVSVEHILPQTWDWIRDKDDNLKKMSEDDWDTFRKEIDGSINGIGNLLLITPGENTSVGNKHPADKRYDKYCSGGSYEKHNQNSEKWRASDAWTKLISDRGEKIFNYMLRTLVDTPPST